jgi:hypothetical protein
MAVRCASGRSSASSASAATASTTSLASSSTRPLVCRASTCRWSWGLFLGAQEYGSGAQKQKRCLLLDTEPFRYQKFCSDIAGQDIRAHGNQPARVIAVVRAMLATALNGEGGIPGAVRILERYQAFRDNLPELCEEFHLRPSETQFVELRVLIHRWLTRYPL